MSKVKIVRNLATLGCCLLMAATSACSAAPPPSLEPLPRIEDYRPSDWDLTRRQQTLDELAEVGRLASVPEVEVLRWTNPEENLPLIAECLQSEGFAVQVTGSGFESNIPDDQWEAYHLAYYTCTARYPVRLDLDRPPTEDEVEALYWHLTKQFLPCLAEEG